MYCFFSGSWVYGCLFKDQTVYKETSEGISLKGTLVSCRAELRKVKWAEQWGNGNVMKKGIKAVVAIVQSKAELLCCHVRWHCGFLCLVSSWKLFLRLVIVFGVGGFSAIVWTEIIPLHQMVYHPSLQSLWQAHPEEVMIPIKEWTEVEIELTNRTYSILPRLQKAILDLWSAACSC